MKLLFLRFFELLNYILAIVTFVAYLAPFVNPSTFWPLILFGLAYPAFLVANLAFIVFWLFTKKKFVWISIITILVGFNYTKTVFGFNFSKASEEESIKVLSYNSGGLYQFRKGKYKKADYEELYDFYEKEAFDVVCLQEFTKSGIKKIYKTRAAPFKNLNFKTRGVFTGTNYKMVSKGIFNLSENVNGASWSDILIEGKTYRFYNLHLPSNKISSITNNFRFRTDFFSKKGLKYIKQVIPKYKIAAIKRAEMAEIIAAHIAKSPFPVIVCGDMNEAPVSYTYRKISTGLKDTFVEKGSGWGKTYTGKIPGLRIDYIFVSPKIEIVDFMIRKNDFSDHYPLICKLKLKQD